MAGGVIALGSLFAFLLLFAIDSFSRSSNPYLGVLTYIVAPGFLLMGLGLVFLGAYIENKRTGKGQSVRAMLHFDLSRPRDQKVLKFFLGGTTGFLLLTAVGSYYTYHFTESPRFCGEVCHTVMEPEMTTYQNSPHARVSCAACHIGPGATWYVRSKLSGAYQVYAAMVGNYPRPIPTPVKNLRPAPDTCEQCHWPKEFVGNLDRMFNYYLAEQSNTHFAVRMLIKVGGADPRHGPVGGIHWHMNVANKVEYIATDKERMKIPWVRLTDYQGVVTEYRAPRFTNDISQYQIRLMDCMDCHNRPTHLFSSPEQGVNMAMSLGRIDAGLPWMKSNAVALLATPYTNVAQAVQTIESTLSKAYPASSNVTRSIETVKSIYTNNFFPLMKANWRAYPNNIGHMIWPGCSRCHDDKHENQEKTRKITFSDCRICHIILAQGTGPELLKLKAEGHKFEHPGGELDAGSLCDECHTGGP